MPSDTPNGNPELNQQLATLRSELASLRAQLVGVPEERREGLWNKVDKMLAEMGRVEALIEVERERRREALQTERDIRVKETTTLEARIQKLATDLLLLEIKATWLVRGLGASGFTIAAILAVFYYVFSRIVGGGVP